MMEIVFGGACDKFQLERLEESHSEATLKVDRTGNNKNRKTEINLEGVQRV